ncbi:MAG: hypothetical protein Q8O55_12400 [Dehalococcoidales bacterium]|nr:hypothetical protein [Dehalococcoidales bacterium]
MNKKIALPVILVICIAIGLIFAVGCASVDADTSNSTQAPIPDPTSEPASAPNTTPNVIQQKSEDMGGSFTEDLNVINSQADRLGIKIQSITHGDSTVTVTCQADSYTSFRDYLTALGESGRFTPPIPPPEGYPYIKGGIIKLETKFQKDISGIYYNNLALAPMTASAAIAMLVDIAGESGIDVSVESGKLKVPSASFSQAKVGGGTFQLISFRNIHVQGDYNKVMAFISNLDSGATLENMVLKKVSISEVEVDGKIETRATMDVDIYTKSY